MIPEAKRNAVEQALQMTFGKSEFEDISQLNAGLSSALIFRIVISKKSYLLRVITRTDAMGDPSRYYSCMQSAAEAGLAPHIWYAGIDDRISITDFIEAKPFPIDKARVMIPHLLKRLHSLPRFPQRVNYLDFADGAIRKFQASKSIPEKMTEELFRRYEKIIEVYPRNDRDLVSCHNDLKPDNLLFDGERAWLVDWEAAFLNDRYADLAVVGNFVIRNDEEEKIFLIKYFGDDFTEYQQARFFLMSQYMHLIYLSYFMLLSTADGKPIDLNFNRPDFREFHNRLWEGKIHLLDKDVQKQYAWVHMEQAMQNLQLKRFEESLHIVLNGPVS
ncbi:MAG: phosphotransferase [Chitinophagales bacterium]